MKLINGTRKWNYMSKEIELNKKYHFKGVL